MNKSAKPKKFCFVLMPFDKEFNDIYQLGIKQSCIDAGAYCERVDEQIFSNSILDRIFNQISKADFVIADMTNRNPNVFYEVGYAHALGKTTILLTSNSDDIPFDLKHFPHIIYNDSIINLKEELTTRVKWCVENEITKNEINIDIDIYLGATSLSSNNAEYVTPKNKYPQPSFTIHNKTFKTYNPEDYRIGIITDIHYPFLKEPKGTKTINLPNGDLIHMFPVFEDILYPNSFLGFKTMFGLKRNNDPELTYSHDDRNVVLRIFTPNGTRDFDLTMKYEI